MIEGGVPSLLLRRGFTMKSLLPGMTVTVEGYRARSFELRASGGDITFADGHTLFFSFS